MEGPMRNVGLTPECELGKWPSADMVPHYVDPAKHNDSRHAAAARTHERIILLAARRHGLGSRLT